MATILVVDDRTTNRELLVTLLGYAGHRMLEATDGEAGLVIARAEHPDLIITDIVMPKMDGYEFARQIRADPDIGETKIVFHTSSYVVEETRQLAKACGVSLVISKPIEPEIFLEQIQASLTTDATIDAQPQPETFHHEHMRLLTDTLANKVEELEAEVAERRQAEAALRQSEQRYRGLFENSPISIWEEDFSRVKQHLDQLTAKGITDFRTYFGAHPDELLECAELVRVVDVNKAAIQMYEARDREAMLKALRDFFHQHSPNGFLEELIAVAQNHATFHWEGADHTLTGKPIFINLNWAVAPGYETNYAKVIVSTIDVTETRLVEQQLRESEARYHHILDAMMEGCQIIDFGWRYVYVNSIVAKQGRHRPEELLNHTMMEMYPGIENTELFTILRRCMEQRVPTRMENQFTFPDGSPGWFELSIQPAQEGIFILSTDITERKLAENQIQRQLQRLSGLRAIDTAITSTFDMKVSLAIILNETLTQLRVDAAAILLLTPKTLMLEYVAGQGFTSSAIQQTRLRIGEGFAGRAALERHQIHVTELSQVWHLFVRKQIVQDDAFVSYFAIPLIAKGEVKGVLEIFHRTRLEAEPEWLDFLETLAGQAAIAIDNAQLFEDLQLSNAKLEQRVTERTAELNRANAELERANRAKSDFLANMSHELRTPLNSILGLSESLLEQRRDPLSEYQQRSMRFIESSGRHLLELINDILDLSKIEAGKFDFYPQVVDIHTLCTSSLAFVKEQAIRKTITLQHARVETVDHLYADPRRLKQILVNLLTNAVKFTPEGGQVNLQVHTNAEKGLIQFSVSDSGIGITPEDLQRLFQPFVQVDSRLNRQFEGTGLGLALVQRLTDLHGGSVEVESEVGKGSRFTVNIPWRRDHVLGTETSVANDDLKPTSLQTLEPGKNKVVLLAEDNETNILTIGDYLHSREYEVFIARDGFEALQKAEELNPAIILMDIQMPAMDGLEAIRRLREDHRFDATPIIALTALAMPGDRERCLAAGANEYLSKPVSLKDLLSTIGRLLRIRDEH